MKVERIVTDDGSDSLYVPELDENYHSTHGAVQESSHVYIEQGLVHKLNEGNSKEINILEFGFGTGLNTLLTLIYARGKKTVLYTSLEKYPIDPNTATQLNFGSLLKEIDSFEKIISASWDRWQTINEDFKLRKFEVDFREFTPDQKFDLIYFDAFAPSKQPELWSVDLLKVCYEALAKNGVFVTYSAKGQLRRDLQSLGFNVERLPGPPGKFEMIRATK